MNKVLEDLIALELSNRIDFYWDGSRVKFREEVEIDSGISVYVEGYFDYTYSHEDDTNATYMTWVEVNITDLEIMEDEDGNIPNVSINKSFVEKYLEQYLL
jgi:hypothetical protein